MPIMAKSNDEYTEVKAIKTPDGTEIDYVLSKVDNTYKRTYTAIRELEDTPPLEFKSIKPNANLTNYRIYGQTSRNLFDGEFLQGYWAGADGNFVASDKWICTNKFKCKPSITYTFSFNTISRWYGFAWYDSNGTYISSTLSQESTTQTLPIIYTATSPANAAYFAVDIAGYPYSIDSILPTDVTDLMLVEGSTPLPYEPYGESVGDRTGNLFDENYPDIVVDTVKYISLSVENGEYTISTNMPLSGSASLFLLSGAVISGASTKDNGVWLEHNQTVTVSDNFITIGYRIYDNADPRDYSVMLNAGSTPLPYEPYGYKVPVTVEGKNLLQNTTTSQTINGVTFTVNSDGSITCNGTVLLNKVTFIKISAYLLAGTYIVNGCPKNGDVPTYSIDLRDPSNGYVIGERDTGLGFTFTNSTERSVDYTIRIASGYTCNNLTFYPMIRLASIEDDTYEPYRTPITTPIYLPEQIKKVGDEAEYIDYSEQKLHRVRKNLFYITKFTNNNTQTTTGGVNFSIIDNEVYANGTSTAMYPQASGFDYVLTEGETYAATLYIEGEYTGLPYIYCTTTYDSAGNYQIVLPNVRTIFTALPDTRILFVVQGTGESFNIKYKLLITKATIEDDTYEPYIENTDLDVTLPALPTVTGTNVLSVGTEVQPSDMYIKGNFKMIAGGGE